MPHLCLTEPCHGPHAVMPASLWSDRMVVMTVVLVIIRQNGRRGRRMSDRNMESEAACTRTSQMCCLVAGNKSGQQTRTLHQSTLNCACIAKHRFSLFLFVHTSQR